MLSKIKTLDAVETFLVLFTLRPTSLESRCVLSAEIPNDHLRDFFTLLLNSTSFHRRPSSLLWLAIAWFKGLACYLSEKFVHPPILLPNNCVPHLRSMVCKNSLFHDIRSSFFSVVYPGIQSESRRCSFGVLSISRHFVICTESESDRHDNVENILEDLF
jgi:hypothetical protein